MSQFNNDLVSDFLGTVRKYMQIRGPMTQRELAEATDTGVSTMSRFLNQQTQELNPNLIANITAKLSIPLYEIIDFIEESYVDEFERLVKFYKGGEPSEPSSKNGSSEEELDAPLLKNGGSQRNAQASVRIGRKNTKLVYEGEQEQDDEFKQKLRDLSLKQQGFLSEFLNLDSDERDLVVDVGKNIISYLKQKGIDF